MSLRRAGLDLGGWMSKGGMWLGCGLLVRNGRIEGGEGGGESMGDEAGGRELVYGAGKGGGGVPGAC